MRSFTIRSEDLVGAAAAVLSGFGILFLILWAGGGIGPTASASQPDRAAFDAARAEQRRQGQPTPVFVAIDGTRLNLHAITAYQPAVGGGVLVFPGELEIEIAFATFDSVVRRYTRTGLWRPDWTPPGAAAKGGE